LQGVLIANNTYGPNPVIESDVGAYSFNNTAKVTITGADNLVPVSTVSLPASGLISGVCPLLGPLRNNGGPTLTHALLSHSRGIDEGNNTLNLANDQRGAPFPRASGTPDIGAYEVDHADIIFNANFDGCP
jgi:hypothetical protein